MRRRSRSTRSLVLVASTLTLACAAAPPREPPRIAPPLLAAADRHAAGSADGDGSACGGWSTTTTATSATLHAWLDRADDTRDDGTLRFDPATAAPQRFERRRWLDGIGLSVRGRVEDGYFVVEHRSVLGTFERRLPYAPGTTVELGLPALAWPAARALGPALGRGGPLEVRALVLEGPLLEPRIRLIRMEARTEPDGRLDVAITTSGEAPRAGLRLAPDGHLLAATPPRLDFEAGADRCPESPWPDDEDRDPGPAPPAKNRPAPGRTQPEPEPDDPPED